MTSSPRRATDPFSARGPQDLADLVRSQPLAWICSQGMEGPLSTPLPLMPRFAPDGRLLAVEGHFARSNPQVAALRTDNAASILWMGVQGYVSPSWMADRTQAPTWNYATARLKVVVRFDDDPQVLLRHLRELTDQQEAARTGAWAIDEMGPRLAQLAQRIVSFRADVVECHERYKLGQDERDDVFADILAGLEAAGESALVDWMRRFNPGRGADLAASAE
jgi:predicted FMN-binding regulatory protein PaiB